MLRIKMYLAYYSTVLFVLKKNDFVQYNTFLYLTSYGANQNYRMSA